MDVDQLKRAIALGELLDLVEGHGLALQVNDQGSVRMADGTMIAASIEEALSMLRDMARPGGASLALEVVPQGPIH